jgi:hypothetical protein
MIKCNKCGKELLTEQIPEVHISEVEMPCGDTACDGKATYRNNKSNTNILNEDQAWGPPE